MTLKEREAALREAWNSELGEQPGITDLLNVTISQMRQAVAAEREACAKVARDFIPSPANVAPGSRRAVLLLDKVAARILERGRADS